MFLGGRSTGTNQHLPELQILKTESLELILNQGTNLPINNMRKNKHVLTNAV